MLDLLVHGFLRDSERIATYRSMLLHDSDLANLGLTEERIDILDKLEMSIDFLREASDKLRESVAFLDSLDLPDSDEIVPL